MTEDEFAGVLDQAALLLTADLRQTASHHGQDAFERRVLEVLDHLLANHEVGSQPKRTMHDFPDIHINGFGVEVKYTKGDSWRATGNSVFEGQRTEGVSAVFIVYGKGGGTPEVRWRPYEDAIVHVRLSHAPRFDLNMDSNVSLFQVMDLAYEEFRVLDQSTKMRHVRNYARGRLKEGERTWWLEDSESPEHTLPMQVRLYMRLEQDEKRRLRAEAALLCPKICSPSRTKGKYIDAALYLLTQHGVFCPQVRDLFSAGSVALRATPKRGGNYLLRALQDIESLMEEAALHLDAALFLEYWGEDRPPDQRIGRWLELADQYATDWIPSEKLFR